VETLADRISRDGPLNELDAVGWAIRLAKRIEALHALGVAHGSISPGCVITSAVDRTSKGILVDVRQTPSRLAYQSPERAAGGDLSPVDDVWAIASTLYEALTGTPPFSGATDAELRQRIATTTPAPLAVFDVGDDDLQQILDTAFQRDVSVRTRSATALRRALEEWHPDLTVRSLPPLDDEESTLDEDEDEVRTVMRAPAFPVETPQPAPAAPAYAAAVQPGYAAAVPPGYAAAVPPGYAAAIPPGYAAAIHSAAAPVRPAAGQPAVRPAAGQPAVRPAAGQPAVRPAAGQPAVHPAAAQPAVGQPAGAPSAYGPSAYEPSAYGPSAGVAPAVSAAAGVPAAAQSAPRMEQPLPDDDDDNAATVMREYPAQPVRDGGMLVHRGQPEPRYAPEPAVDARGLGGDEPRYAPQQLPVASPRSRPGGTHVGVPAGGPFGTPARTLADGPGLGSTVALDTGAVPGLPDAPWAPGAAAEPQRPQAAVRPAAGQAARNLAPTFPDEDEISTMLREGPSEEMEPVAPPRRAAEPAPAGAFPPPSGVRAPAAAPFGSGVLGPSPVDTFSRSRPALGGSPGNAASSPNPWPPLGGPAGAPMNAFSQRASGPIAPSPFAAPGAVFEIPEPPPRSPWRGVIILLVVAIAIGAAVALLAARTGALGAAPGVAPPPPLAGSGRLVLGESLDLRLEPAHVDRREQRRPEA
jgi:hypothetical protein